MQTNNLKEVLVSFLKEEEVYYPLIEASIISVQPFLISDDKEYCFELSSMADQLQPSINCKRGQKILLKDWNYIFGRVPGTHKFYFDVVCRSFDIIPDDSLFNESIVFKKILDDDMVKYFFEVIKRKQISALVKNEKPSAGDQLFSSNDLCMEDCYNISQQKKRGFNGTSSQKKAGIMNTLDCNELIDIDNESDEQVGQENFDMSEEVLTEAKSNNQFNYANNNVSDFIFQSNMQTPEELGKRNMGFDEDLLQENFMCEEFQIESQNIGSKKMFN